MKPEIVYSPALKTYVIHWSGKDAPMNSKDEMLKIVPVQDEQKKLSSGQKKMVKELQRAIK